MICELDINNMIIKIRHISKNKNNTELLIKNRVTIGYIILKLKYMLKIN